MVMWHASLWSLSRPDVPDLAATSVAALSNPLLVVADFPRERFEEPTDDLVRIGVIRQIDTLWQPKIHPECQHPRILSQCQFDGVFEIRQALPDERPLVDYQGQAFKGVVVVQMEVVVVGMTQ